MGKHQTRCWLAATLELNGMPSLPVGMASNDCSTHPHGCWLCSRALKETRSQATFAEAQPAELAEWDYEKNDAQGMYPDNTTFGSVKPVHWICSCCPRRQPHPWTASPQNRIGRGSRCALCAAKQTCVSATPWLLCFHRLRLSLSLLSIVLFLTCLTQHGTIC